MAPMAAPRTVERRVASSPVTFPSWTTSMTESRTMAVVTPRARMTATKPLSPSRSTLLLPRVDGGVADRARVLLGEAARAFGGGDVGRHAVFLGGVATAGHSGAAVGQ